MVDHHLDQRELLIEFINRALVKKRSGSRFPKSSLALQGRR